MTEVKLIWGGREYSFENTSIDVLGQIHKELSVAEALFSLAGDRFGKNLMQIIWLNENLAFDAFTFLNLKICKMVQKWRLYLTLFV